MLRRQEVQSAIGAPGIEGRPGGRLAARGLAILVVAAAWTSASAPVNGAPVTGAPTASAPDTTIVRGEIGMRLDAIVREAEGQGFHGVVLVAQGGEEILAKGYGIANAATGARFTPETVVPIGSNVKDFTRVAILQLVEAGSLRLDDAVGRFFPKVPPDKRGITIEQLLEHRAGFPQGIGPDDEMLSREAFLQRLFATPLGSAPGASEEYSNAGYSLLAAVIETVTGKPFDAHVDRAIFRKAGLTQTGLLIPCFDPARLAHGYRGGKDQGTMLDRPHTPDGHTWNLRGNGGMLATARDQLRFFRALGGPALLARPEHRARVLDPSGASVLAGSDMVSHFLFGNFPGVGVEIVVASNHAEFGAPRLLRLLQPALGIEPPPRREPGSAERTGNPTLPDTGPGRTVAAWLEAFNSGDEGLLRRFFEERGDIGPDATPIETRLANHRRIRGDLGRLTILDARPSATGIDLEVRGDAGRDARLKFEVESGEPFRLRALRVEIVD